MKTITRSALIKRMDRLRQTIARYEGAYKKGGRWYNTCVTCGKEIECEKANGGHFLSRTCQLYRWDEKNVHCQCVGCNLYRNGAYIEYSQWFIKKYGQKVFDKYVNDFKRHKQGKIPPYKLDELKTIYDYWLLKGRELEKKTKLELFPKTWTYFGEQYLDYNPTNN